MSPFECARKLLDGSQASLSLSQKMDLVFQDMDLVPLLIQENYVNHKPNLGVTDEQHMKVGRIICPSMLMDQPSSADRCQQLLGIVQDGPLHIDITAMSCARIVTRYCWRTTRHARLANDVCSFPCCDSVRAALWL